MIRQSGPKPWPCGNRDDPGAAPQLPQRIGCDQPRRDGCAHRRALRAERRDWSEPPDEDEVEREIEHRHRDAEHHRRARITGRPQRRAQHEEHHHAADEDEHDAEERQRFGFDGRRGVDEIEQPRGCEIAERRHDAERQERRGEKRLVHGAVDFLGIACTGEARHQHAHPREQRRDEDDDDENDLPADANRRVAGEPDEVPDEHVIDDPLQAADDIGEHRRPRDLPDRRLQRPFDDRSVVAGSVENCGHRIAEKPRLSGRLAAQQRLQPVYQHLHRNHHEQHPHQPLDGDKTALSQHAIKKRRAQQNRSADRPGNRNRDEQ